jgi:hypothetical protein
MDFFLLRKIIYSIITSETIINAAWMLIAYNVWVLLMQQIVRHFGTYELLFQLLLLPLDIFGIIPEVLLKLGIAKFSIWIAILSEFFAPLLFILFAKKR